MESNSPRSLPSLYPRTPLCLKNKQDKRKTLGGGSKGDVKGDSIYIYLEYIKIGIEKE